MYILMNDLTLKRPLVNIKKVTLIVGILGTLTIRQILIYKFFSWIFIIMYSSSHKSSIFCSAQLLLQIFVNYQNQGQIWNLLVMTFSKHPLHVQFDQVLAEIFEVEDT